MATFGRHARAVNIGIDFSNATAVRRTGVYHITMIAGLYDDVGRSAIIVLTTRMDIRTMAFDITFTLRNNRIAFHEERHCAYRPTAVFDRRTNVAARRCAICVRIVKYVSHNNVFLFATGMLGPCTTLIVFTRASDVLAN